MVQVIKRENYFSLEHQQPQAPCTSLPDLEADINWNAQVASLVTLDARPALSIG
jgi:hypothetical protein